MDTHNKFIQNGNNSVDQREPNWQRDNTSLSERVRFTDIFCWLIKLIHSITYRTNFKANNEIDHALPGYGAAEEEHHNSLSIFLVLVLLGLCILLIHTMLKFHFHYVPESVAVIFIGGFSITAPDNLI